MIMAAFSTIAARWQLVLAVVLLWALSLQVHGCNRYRDGREAALAQLRKAETEAVDRSLRAAAKADEWGAREAEKRAAIIAGQITRIEEAERRGESAVDALMGW